MTFPDGVPANVKRTKTIVQIVLFIVIGLLAVPIIGLAIKGLIGIAIAALIGFIGFIGISLVPLVADKVAKWKLKEYKNLAAKNPIETLQRNYLAQAKQLEERKAKIERFDMSTRTFQSKLQGFKKQYPEEASQFDEQLAAMGQLLNNQREKYYDAKEAMDKYADEIHKADAIWKMSVAATEASKDMGSVEEDWTARINTETALESVRNQMNLAFARLDTSLLDRKEQTKALPTVVKQLYITPKTP